PVEPSRPRDARAGGALARGRPGRPGAMIPIKPLEGGRSAPAPAAGAAGQGAAPGVTEPPPLSLYVHLPWCIRKCPYCDFNSHEFRDGDSPPEDRYVDALIADLESALPSVWGRSVQTVFIGGG